MKRIFARALLAIAALSFTTSAEAQSITDLLGGLTGSGTGQTIVNALEGVFSKSDITVADIAGQWATTGPAVSFKSDNLLKKAGGIAGAAALETKLAPYYKQYGLDNMTLSIDNDGNFTMGIKKLQIQGTMVANKGEGTFEFNIKALGAVPLGSFTAYVTTTGKTMDIMFDATKLKSLLSTIVKLTGNKLASGMASILDSYDGACIGFKMSKTGNATGSSSNTNKTDSTGKSGGIEDLLNLFGK